MPLMLSLKQLFYKLHSKREVHAGRWLLLAMLLGNAMAQAQGSGIPIASENAVQQVQFLDVDDAFTLNLDNRDTAIELVWVIAPEYYLYKHKFKIFGISHATGKRVDLTENTVFAKGLRKNDDYFGMVEVYYYQAVANLNTALQIHGAIDTLEVSYQGCADAGLCYPVQTRKLSLSQ